LICECLAWDLVDLTFARENALFDRAKTGCRSVIGQPMQPRCLHLLPALKEASTHPRIAERLIIVSSGAAQNS